MFACRWRCEFYRLASIAAAPAVASRLLAWRLKRGKEDPARLSERYGLTKLPRPDGPLIWLHGASVGEMLAVIPLIQRIRAMNFAVLVTSGTVTSAALAQQRLPAGAVHQFIPLDAPRFVGRFLDHWQPDLALFVESDLWPNLILTCAGRGIPMILINGRVSERSFNRWRRLPGVIATLLGCFDLCLTQSSVDTQRYSQLGAPRISSSGNLKLDVPAPPADQAALRKLKSTIGTRPVIAAASTHAGEEAAIIAVHHQLRAKYPSLLTVIAPRHPDRGSDIVESAKAAGLSVAVRSRGDLPNTDVDIFVADTLGELGYNLSAGADRVHGRVARQPWRPESDRGHPPRRRCCSWPERLEFRRDLRHARRRAWSRTHCRRGGADGMSRQLARASCDTKDSSRCGTRYCREARLAHLTGRWQRSSLISCSFGSNSGPLSLADLKLMQCLDFSGFCLDA